jgi:hypothetical protein
LLKLEIYDVSYNVNLEVDNDSYSAFIFALKTNFV